MRQTGGHGQFGHCWIELTPTEPGSGVTFENKIVGGVIPKEFIPPIENGEMCIRDRRCSLLIGSNRPQIKLF